MISTLLFVLLGATQSTPKVEGIWATEDNSQALAFVSPGSGLGVLNEQFFGFAWGYFVPDGSFLARWDRAEGPYRFYKDSGEYKMSQRDVPRVDAPSYKRILEGTLRFTIELNDRSGNPSVIRLSYMTAKNSVPEWTKKFSFVSFVQKPQFAADYESKSVGVRLVLDGNDGDGFKGWANVGGRDYDVRAKQDGFVVEFGLIDRSSGQWAGGGYYQWYPTAADLEDLRSGQNPITSRVLLAIYEGKRHRNAVMYVTK